VDADWRKHGRWPIPKRNADPQTYIRKAALPRPIVFRKLPDGQTETNVNGAVRLLRRGVSIAPRSTTDTGEEINSRAAPGRSAATERRRGGMPPSRRLRRSHRRDAELMGRLHQRKRASLTSPTCKGRRHHHPRRAPPLPRPVLQKPPWLFPTISEPTPGRRMPSSLEDGGRYAPWRANLQLVRHPSELSCRLSAPWTSLSLLSTGAENINSGGSPAIGGLCGLTVGARWQPADVHNAPRPQPWGGGWCNGSPLLR